MGWGDCILGWAAALAGLGRGVTGSRGGAWGFDRAHFWGSLWGLAVGEGGSVGYGRRFAPNSLNSLPLGIARVRRCPMTALQLLDDRSATGAGRRATFGDTGRKNLDLQMGTRSSDLQSWQWSALRGDSSEEAIGERLMAICYCAGGHELSCL